MKTIILSVIVSVITTLAVIALFHTANVRAAALSDMQECVVSTAKAEGYAGNAYSQQAWELFAPSCI